VEILQLKHELESSVMGLVFLAHPLNFVILRACVKNIRQVHRVDDFLEYLYMIWIIVVMLLI
jgi:hypothetical protein